MRLEVGLNGSDEEKASPSNSESSCQDRAGSITPMIRTQYLLIVDRQMFKLR